MRRFNLFELHDFAWCPKILRDGLTDFLEISIDRLDSYGAIRKQVLGLLCHSETDRVIDLCSGAGGPWVHWLRKGLVHSRVTLTDKYPNAELNDRLARSGEKALRYRLESVDALAVPPELKGVRTMFTAFHHFRPEQAKAIIDDAVRNGQPIGIFELTSRSLKGLLAMLVSPLGVWLFTPCMASVNWRKCILTYLIPVIPLLVGVDGVLSCLRSYSVEELSSMATAEGYSWYVGTESNRGLPVTYLIGYPKKSQ